MSVNRRSSAQVGSGKAVFDIAPEPGARERCRIQCGNTFAIPQKVYTSLVD